jgi:hypothetical protein
MSPERPRTSSGSCAPLPATCAIGVHPQGYAAHPNLAIAAFLIPFIFYGIWRATNSKAAGAERPAALIGNNMRPGVTGVKIPLPIGPGIYGMKGVVVVLATKASQENLFLSALSSPFSSVYTMRLGEQETTTCYPIPRCPQETAGPYPGQILLPYQLFHRHLCLPRSSPVACLWCEISWSRC